MRKFISIAVGVVASTLPASRAGGQRDVLAVPGRWPTPTIDVSGFPAALAAQGARLKATMLQIYGMIKVLEPVAKPVGFCLVTTLYVHQPEPRWRVIPDPGRWPAIATMSTLENQNDPNFPDEAGSCTSKLGDDAFDFAANSIGSLFGAEWRQPFDSDAAGPFYDEPKRVDDYRGFPAYEWWRGATKAGRMVVITKRTEPLWKPVTRERFLTEVIATERTSVASADKNADNPFMGDIRKQLHARLEAHQKLLASLSPAERAEQAVLHDFPGAENPFAGDRVSRPLVSPNVAFFDRTRPAGDLQLLTVGIPIPCESNCTLARPRVLKALQDLDWNALAALVR